MTEEKLNGLVIHDIPSKALFDELVKRGVIGEHDLSFVEDDAVESLGITGAYVGQVPVVKSVDENGVPNGWGLSDMDDPKMKLIADDILTEPAASWELSEIDGEPMKLKEFELHAIAITNADAGLWFCCNAYSDLKNPNSAVYRSESACEYIGATSAKYMFWARGYIKNDRIVLESISPTKYSTSVNTTSNIQNIQLKISTPGFSYQSDPVLEGKTANYIAKLTVPASGLSTLIIKVWGRS